LRVNGVCDEVVVACETWNGWVTRLGVTYASREACESLDVERDDEEGENDTDA
jgi:hypothetical protein